MKNKVVPLLMFLPFGLIAQEKPEADSLPELRTAPVEIRATRLTVSEINAPMAVTVLDKSWLQTATQQLSPYEALGSIPGVFALNPDNYAQDLRISIRGFGARAAFGIRGIRVFTDGIPEGTPDGQVDVDNLDMGLVNRMEVLRGPASGLYGNASGGVIYLSTEMPEPGNSLIEVSVMQGMYGFQRHQVKSARNKGKFAFLLSGSYIKMLGYRRWSQMENTIFSGKMEWKPRKSIRLALLGNYGASPRANDPGGLTQQQADSDPRQAGANNLLYETGEAVTQGRLGLVYEQRFSARHRFEAKVYGTGRHLENRLAIAANGYGDLKRNFQGLQVNYQLDSKSYRLKAGIDLENQADNRRRFAYRLADRYEKGDEVLHQVEKFQSLGLFVLQDIRPVSNFLVSLGLRYDALKLSAEDRFLTDGDQSGKRHFDKFNPNIGLNYAIADKVSVYANYGSTFETPTLNELSNNPEGTGGFNPALSPQSARSFELGARGKVPVKYSDQVVQLDLAIYQIDTRNDLVAYQIDGQPGKNFYRNAGQTSRKGIEIGLGCPVFKVLTVFGTQTLVRYRYASYTVNGISYDGNQLPGIPNSNTQLELRYALRKGTFAFFQVRNAQKIYANDANSAFAPAYTVMNLRVGHKFRFRTMSLEPYLGINNLSDVRYMANVQLNAGGERYFEPGAGRYWWGGVKWRLE